LSNFAALRKAAMITLALLACSCSDSEQASKPATTSPLTEAVSDNTFKNEYFGITVTKPEDWHSAPHEVIDQVMGIGGEIVSAGNEDLKRVLDVSTKRNHSIFMVSKYEFGAPVPLNPNIIGVAESVGFMPGVKTGEDYFFHVKKMMAQSALNIQFDEGYSQRNIGGVPFDAMDLTLTMNGAKIKETYYAARHGDFVISIIEIYGSDEFKDETSAVIDTIELDWR
jgi:hypothetical protein